MDLRNNQITMGELLADPRSRAVLQQYFPQFVNNPMMVHLGRNRPLQQVLGMARGHIPADKLQKALEALRNI